MGVRVVESADGHRVADGHDDAGLINRFLDHLLARLFSPATVRAYAFDLANFLGFLVERGLAVVVVRPADLFDYLEWQREQRASVAASTMNRRVSTVRSWCEFLVTIDVLKDNPVPRARRSSGLRVVRRGMLGHAVRVPRSSAAGGRLVSQPSRLPESLDADDVGVFLADLNTHRDRAMVLAMVLGGLRSASSARAVVEGVHRASATGVSHDVTVWHRLRPCRSIVVSEGGALVPGAGAAGTWTRP